MARSSCCDAPQPLKADGLPGFLLSGLVAAGLFALILAVFKFDIDIYYCPKQK